MSDTPWLQVLGGKRFDLVNPRASDVDFQHMAVVLGRTPRFTGHTEDGVYSVAQHCVEGAYAVLRDTGSRELAAAFLLHDAHEYVIGDLAIPVRDALMHYAILERGDLGAGDTVRQAIRALKRALDEVIYTAAGIPWPLDARTVGVVKAYDTRMLRTERDARLAPPPEPWAPIYEAAVPVAGVDLSPRGEVLAARFFMRACEAWLPVLACRRSPDDFADYC